MNLKLEISNRDMDDLVKAYYHHQKTLGKVHHAVYALEFQDNHITLHCGPFKKLIREPLYPQVLEYVKRHKKGAFSSTISKHFQKHGWSSREVHGACLTMEAEPGIYCGHSRKMYPPSPGIKRFVKKYRWVGTTRATGDMNMFKPEMTHD